jgi:hypothetical protein
MKNFLIINLMLLMTLFTHTLKSQQSTNDFYDEAETFSLKGTTIIQVGGEIGNPGDVDITKLPSRSLVIKEALAKGDSNKFVGAYRYDGYSLYDILNNVILKKKNEAEFPPIIDLYVKVENDRGESVVISWGEIYYPVHRHEIIIATKVARIVPSKTKDLWPLPQETKLVVGTDLLTERNISNPVKITVFSSSVSYPVKRSLTPLFSPGIKILNGDKLLQELMTTPVTAHQAEYETIFYGRGRGIHSTTPFDGVLLKDVLKSFYSTDQEKIRKGLFVVAGADGYRSVYTFSEIFNRNDQAEVLLIEDRNNQDGGAYRLFPAADFFSDRAVKAVSEIKLITQ